MWAQQWGNIYDVVAPDRRRARLRPRPSCWSPRATTPIKMVKTGEGFYSSLGFAPLPQTFWERSMITRPRDREVVCHASAWDIDNAGRHPHQDVHQGERPRTSTPSTTSWVTTTTSAPTRSSRILFRDGANDGFHEAIGDFVGLSALTPDLPATRSACSTRCPGDGRGHPVPAARWRSTRSPSCRSACWSTAGAGRCSTARSAPAKYNDAWWALRAEVPGPDAAGTAPGRRLRSGRQVPRRRQHALHALLPGPHLPVPVPPRGLPAGRLDGPAAPLLDLRQQGGRARGSTP